MEYDPEYLAAIDAEQCRLIWDEIRRITKQSQDRERMRAYRALKRKGDLLPHRKSARGLPTTTYAAHRERHRAKTA